MTLLLLLALVAVWGGVLFALGAAAERERNVTVDLLLGGRDADACTCGTPCLYCSDHRDDATAIGDSTGYGGPVGGGRL